MFRCSATPRTGLRWRPRMGGDCGADMVGVLGLHSFTSSRIDGLRRELDDRTKGGALNLGIGAAITYGGGSVRTSATVGTSTLLFDTVFDEAGRTGFFADIRPITLLDGHGLALFELKPALFHLRRAGLR